MTRELGVARSPEDVARALPGDHAIWDDGTGVVVAAGVRASVVVDGSAIAILDASGRATESTETRDPFADLGPILARAGLGPDERAYGYLGFGLASFRYPYEKGRTGRALHLVIPRVTCRVREGAVVVDGDDEAVAAIEAPPAPPPAARAPIGGVGGTTPNAIDTSVIESAESRAYYTQVVEDVREAIRRGDVDKVIVARHVRLRERLDHLATFARTGATAAMRRYAFRLGGVTGVGACPGIVLSSDGRTVSTNPLAGTRPRGKTEAEDAALVTSLLRDAKELAEHAMSIRIAYDEIAEVVDTPSVVDFMRVKRFAFTHHISSVASGVLSNGRTSWDALRAVFPGVTVTGGPKRASLAIVDRLEDAPRRIYGGAFGWVSGRGAMDFGITIRSAFDYGDGVSVSAGAGLVVDSEPEYEFMESVHKMRTMASRVVVG